MALRLVEIYMPEGLEGLVDDLNDTYTLLSQVSFDLQDGRKLMRVLIETSETESFLDELDRRIGSEIDFRAVLMPVEATLPRPQPDETEAPKEKKPQAVARISREELYQDVDGAIRSSNVFYAMVVLSTIVAAIGLLKNNVAVVIGAMVIAPLLGPNMALALGTALGDPKLLRRAAKVNIAGVSIALIMAIVIGWVFNVDPTGPEVASRTTVAMSDVILALAAGVAGTLSITLGVASTLVGVMVAVALLPPLVTVGMMIGIGAWDLAYRAFLLLVTNIVSVNLAAVSTFLIQGVRPNSYFEIERAKKATRIVIILCLLALGLLAVAILLANGTIG